MNKSEALQAPVHPGEILREDFNEAAQLKRALTFRVSSVSVPLTCFMAAT